MRTAATLLTGMLALAFTASDSRAQGTASNGEIKVYLATEATVGEPEPQPPLRFGTPRAPELTVTVDSSVRYQEIEGFGASLTDSSAWLFAKRLDANQRAAALRQLFDPERGIGLNLLREPLGASDFAVEDYTYDDLPTGQADPQLGKFSIEKDQRYILPVLKEALAVNPKIKVLATPWSAPGWMKSTDSMIGGSLKPDAYPVYAKYLVKSIEAYQSAGVPIFALTMQNEPLFEPNDYPGMGMSAAQQADFLGNHLGPAMRAAHLQTRVFVFDHNWDLIHYPIEVLSDPKAAQYVAGIATHCYGGNATAQNELHERFPKVDIWFTECSGGGWQKGNLLTEQVGLVIDVLRNWSRSVILWNLALDQNHEPHLGGCKDCRGVVTVEQAPAGSVVRPTVDFTALAMASKFVRRGAQRIASNSFGRGSLEDVAFRNPDGSLVLLVLNSSQKPMTFNIAWAGKYASYELKPDTAATFVWQENQRPPAKPKH